MNADSETKTLEDDPWKLQEKYPDPTFEHPFGVYKKLKIEIPPAETSWQTLNDRVIDSLNSSIVYFGNNIRAVSIILLIALVRLGVWLIGAAVSALTAEDHSLERIQRAQKILSTYIE